MTQDATYGTFATVPFYSDDGFKYRVLVQAESFGGSSTEVDAVRGGVRVSLGTEGGASSGLDVLAPVATLTIALTLRDEWRGLFTTLIGQADGYLRAILEREETLNAGDWAEVCEGFVQQEDYGDDPDEPHAPVSLVFKGSVGVLDARAFAGAGTPVQTFHYERVVGAFARCLGPLGASDERFGLTTAMQWFPYLEDADGDPVHVTTATDPLRALATHGVAWIDDDGASPSQMVALRALAARFGCRLFQWGGRWWLMQRDLLAADPEAVPTFPYPAGGTYGINDAAVTKATADLLVDTRAWRRAQGTAAPRETTLPVRSVASTYHFDPGLDSFLLNHSFEEAGPAGSSTAKYWVFSGNLGGGARVDGSGTPLGASFGDIYVAKVYGFGPTEDVTEARQKGFVYLPAAAAWTFAMAWNASWHSPASMSNRGGLLVKVGAYYLWQGTATVGHDQRHGAKARVYVEGLLDGAAGAVEGTPLIPEGATLEFFRTGDGHVASLTLTREAKVGDTELEGNLSADLEIGDEAQFFYWKSGGGAPILGVGTDEATGLLAMVDQFGTRRVFATGYALDGERVSGYIDVDIVGPAANADGNGAVVYALYDDIQFDVRVDGETVSAAGTVVSRGDTEPGIEGALPLVGGAHPVGDGPLPDSESRLICHGSDGQQYDTMQGEDTGWKVGPYVGAEASTGRTLDALLARRALQQSAGPLERFRATFLLRNRQRYDPFKAALVDQGTELAQAATAGASQIVTRAAPHVGHEITVGVGTANVETHTVTAVSRTPGAAVVTLDGTLASSHDEGAPCRYAFAAWWDHLEWIVDTGELYFDGSALTLADDSKYAEAVTLGAETGGGGGFGGGLSPVTTGGGGGGGEVPTTLEHTFLGSQGFSFSPATINHADDATVTLTPPQDLRTTASPTFDTPTVDQLTLLGAGTGTDHAVRADRTLQITTGNGITGGGSALNLTANRAWTLGLTGQALALHNLASNGLIARTAAATVAARQMATGSPNSVTWANANAVGGNPSISLAQDIHTAATPRFARLGLGAAAHGTHALYVNGTSSFEDDLTSPTFVSGFGGEGFRIQRDTAGGKGANYWEGTFDELWVRGRMHVYELIVQQIRATNGSVLVANAAKVKTVAPGVGVGSYDLTFDLDYTVFAVNDILLAQRFEQTSGGQTTVYQSFVRVTGISGTTVTVAVLSSSDPPEAGFDYVRIGNTTDADRQGSVYLTADDQDAPYIDVRDGVDSVAAWGGGASKVRLGKLDGITDAEFGVLSGYGLWAGNAYVTGRAVVREGQIGSATVHWLLGSEGAGAAEAAYLRSVAHASNTLSIEAGVDFARVVANATNVETQEVALFVEDGGGWGLRGVVDGFEFFRLGSANHIAGWSFNETQFSGGNIRLVKTGRIWNTGGGWDLQNDGSGQVASGNIAWDASGNVTFDPSVTLSWAQITSVPTLNLLGAVADTSDVWGGAFPPSGWASYGGDSFGSILVDEGPFGDDEPLWRARRTSGTGDAGGTNLTAHAAVDTSKRHRISFFFRGPVSASLFFDAKYTTPNCINRSNATTGGFSQTRWMDVTSAEVDESRWMLFVGYVYPKGTFNSPTVHTVQSGIYDAVTGERLLAADFDLAWNASAGAEEALAYTAFQISFGTPAETLFARPRIDVVDESGYVTLTDLLSASATTITRHLVSAPLIQGATIEAGQKIYVGAGNYANADTAFYTDNTGGGRISIGNRLTFSVSGGTFALGGNLTVGAGGNVTVSSTGFISAGGGVVRLGSYGARITAGAADANKLSWRNALDTTDLGSLNVGTDSVATLYGDQGIRFSTAAGAKIRSLTTSSLWEIDKANFVVLVDGEPADSALQNGTLAVWGSSGDTGFLYVKFKTSGGIIVKRRVALSSY